MPSAFDRINMSAPVMGLKDALRKHSPQTAERWKAGVNAARRAMREPPPPPLDDQQLLWDPPPRRVEMRAPAAGEVTNALYARLDERDLSELRARLDDAERKLWEGAGADARKALAVHLCVHHDVPGVVSKLGLSRAEPPADVTSLARGSTAAGGSLELADVVADSLREAGVPLSERRRALEFGCSSGRVTRVLAVTYPEIEWHGCDPDSPAVAWAEQNIGAADFFVSAVEPPLPFPDAHFDLIYAFSIWTHFSEAAALRWLEEMRRLLGRGGHLLLTTHGNRAVEYHRDQWGQWWPRRLIAEVATALWTDGYKFVSGYGRGLSQAEATPDWGEAFLSAEWLARRLCPQWAIAVYEPGRIDRHHDLYVLERR